MSVSTAIGVDAGVDFFESEEFNKDLNLERKELNIMNLHTFYLSKRITLNPMESQKELNQRTF